MNLFSAFEKAFSAASELSLAQSQLAVDAAQAQLKSTSAFFGAVTSNPAQAFSELTKRSAETTVQWGANAVKAQQEFVAALQPSSK